MRRSREAQGRDVGDAAIRDWTVIECGRWGSESSRVQERTLCQHRHHESIEFQAVTKQGERRE